MAECRALFGGERDSEFHGKQSEERGELYDGVQCDGRSVLKRVADCVTDDGGFVEGSALLLQFGLHDLLGVIPATARVGHKDCLVQTEERNGDEVADEEERFGKGEGKRCKEDGQEDVEHTFLSVLGADFDYLLAVCD